MRRLFLILAVIVLLASTTIAAISPSVDEKRTYKNSYRWTGKPKDLLLDWAQAIEDAVDGTSTVDNLLFSLSTSDPTSTEGRLYYNTTSNLFKFYNGSSWNNIAAESGTVSLDVAYNNGNSIDVDGSAITMTVSDTDNNPVLSVVQNDSTNDPDAMNITSAADLATAVGLQIDCTAGFDIQGTSDSWSVSIAGIFDGEGLTGLTNSQTINLAGNNEIEFGDNSEDVSFNFSVADTLTWTTDTAVTTVDWGDLDAHTGLNAIAFDGAVANTITQTGTGSGDDLTISQAGAVDASLILTSAGTSTTDALIITSVTGSTQIDSADNLDIDAADDITIDTAGGAMTVTSIGGDITVDASDKSVIIRGTEEAADAIVIDADGTAGGITIDYGTGNMVVIGTGASADFTLDADLISIDGTGASNITCTNGAGEDFTISTAGAADHSLIIQTTGTTADSLQIISTAGGIDVTNGGAAGGEDVDIDAVLASLNLNADEDVAESVTITASTGGIDITADGAAAKDLDLVCTNGSTNISGGEAIADAVTLVAGAGGIDISSAATFDIDVTATGGTVQVIASEAAANQFKVDAQGAHAGNVIVLETTNGGIQLLADGSDNGDIDIDCEDDMTITAVGDLAVTLTGDGTVQGTWLPATIVKKTIVTGAVTSADCGYVLQVAVDAQTITLPATVAGLSYTIMCTAADGGALLTIELDNVDKFVGAGFAPADGEAMTIPKATQNRGDYFKVTAHVDGWIITEMVGTWAEATP
ncbi:MAG: hypothetical protein KAS32_10760 [Candidatus Peribacteraceae bacterium]|nr:hypothetical protein [Candidatus Peribacteraceae bacterium]